MMTYAWTLGHILSSELKPLDHNAITMSYIVQLVKQLTPQQALYAEICWRDPIDEVLPNGVANAP